MELAEIKDYLKRTGQRGAEIYKVVKELRPVIDVFIEKGEGAKILEDDVIRHMEIFQKVYESLISTGSADIGDIKELQYLHNRLIKLAKRLRTYEQGINEITKKE